MQAKGFGLADFSRIERLVDALILFVLFLDYLLVFVGQLVPLHLQGMLLLSQLPDPVRVRVRVIRHEVFIFFAFLCQRAIRYADFSFWKFCFFFIQLEVAVHLAVFLNCLLNLHNLLLRSFSRFDAIATLVEQLFGALIIFEVATLFAGSCWRVARAVFHWAGQGQVSRAAEVCV